VRTTIGIDDDLILKLKDISQKRRISFRDAVNEVLRRGLSAQESKRHPKFCAKTFRSAFRPGIDPLRLNQLVDELEVERITRSSNQ
jgi:hypothetical protein